MALAICSAMALVGLTGCEEKSETTGQVVASIDGEDITQRDIRSELLAENVQAAPQTQAQRSEVLERIISRKLLAIEAKKARLDKSPDYLAAVQRMREVILASMLVNERMQQFPTPSSAEVQQFINDNPQKFSGRKIYDLDQISTSVASLDKNELQKLNSNEEVVRYLTTKKHPFQRRRSKLDAVSLPKEMVNQIDKLPDGMPFIIANGQQLLINSKVNVINAPIGPKEQQNAAMEILKKQNVEKALEEQVNYRRKAVKIEYKPGYAPVESGASADKK
nr:EpsD family peptidyl-prolyl cis-trans isomerase [Sphingobium phenoxybenzoativorans]